MDRSHESAEIASERRENPPKQSPVTDHDPKHIVFFDGVCVFCNAAVVWLSQRDPEGVLYYASLQGETAAHWRSRLAGQFPTDIDTMVFLDLQGPDPVMHLRSRAALEVAALLESPVRHFALLRILPAVFTDLPYRVLAALRYRLFGRFDVCPLPGEDVRAHSLP